MYERIDDAGGAIDPMFTLPGETARLRDDVVADVIGPLRMICSVVGALP